MTDSKAPFRLHPPLFHAVRQIIIRVFHDHSTLEHAFRQVTRANTALGSRDRRLIGAAAYEIIRYWRRYSALTNNEDTDLTESSINARIQCWAQVQQVAEHASAEMPFHVFESWPDWYMSAATGVVAPGRWHQILQALNSPAPLDIRVNTLRYSVADILKMLEAFGVRAVPIPDTDGIRIETHLRLDQLKTFPEDAFEVQDAGSQIAGNASVAHSGMRILDACAGGGGKTLQLACEIRDQGYILATDAQPKRLEGLRSRLSKFRYKSVHILEAGKPIPEDPFDVVLLDVPCTGTGTIRRQPERKYHVIPEEVAKMVSLQQDIVRAHIKYVAQGGVLVYVTCSIFPDENERQAAWITQHYPDFQLEFNQRLSPDQDGTDGFFVARFRRK